jgi:hypothetical protein
MSTRWCPPSIFEIDVSVRPTLRASARCVKPNSSRAALMTRPSSSYSARLVSSTCEGSVRNIVPLVGKQYVSRIECRSV